MTHVLTSSARWVAWSALWFGLASGVIACQAASEPTPPVRELPDAARTSVEVSPAGARANGQDTLDIRVTVRRADGGVMQGQTVTVTASGEGNTLSQPPGPTNADGVAIARLASTVPGLKTVTATVEAEGGAVTLASRPTVEFLSVSAPHLAFLTHPPAHMRAGQTFEVRVALTDAQDPAPVTLSLDRGTLRGTTTVTPVDGVASFPGLSIAETGLGQVLTASASGLASASSAAFDITADAAARLEWTAPPQTVVAGAPVSLTLTAYDAHDNVATDYTGTVRLVSNEVSDMLPANHTFTPADQGRHTFTLTPTRARPRQVSATDVATGALTHTARFEVMPASPTKLVFSRQPTNTHVHSPFEVRVSLADAYDNLLSTSSSQVTLTVNQGTLSGRTTVPTQKGEAIFTDLSLSEAGTGYVLMASAAELASAESQAFAIMGGTTTIDRLQLTAALSTVTAGTPVDFTLTALDVSGNPVTDYTGTVHFTSSEASDVLPAAYTFTLADQGRFTFRLTPTREATHEVRAADETHSAQVQLTVFPGPTARMVFWQPPSDRIAGESFGVQVGLLDAYGNRTYGMWYQVRLTLNKGTLYGGAAFSQYGVASFGLTIPDPGTGYVLTASCPGLPSITSEPFAMSDGGAVKMTVWFDNEVASVQAGEELTVTVRLFDRFGQLETGYTDTVSFTSSDPAASLPPSYTFTAADGGQKTFPVTLKTVDAPYSRTVSVTDGRLRALTSVSVKPAALSAVAFRTQPLTTQMGQTLQAITVALTDAYGNTVPVDSPAVELGLMGGTSAATLLGTLRLVPDKGLATFSDLSVDQPGTNFRLSVMADKLNSATSNYFDIMQGVAPASSSTSVDPR